MSNSQQPEVPQRRYTIDYRRGGVAPLGRLEPGVRSGLYTKREIAFAIDLMLNYPCFKQLVVQLENELFIVSELADGRDEPKAFTFDTGAQSKGLHIPG